MGPEISVVVDVLVRLVAVLLVSSLALTLAMALLRR